MAVEQQPVHGPGAPRKAANIHWVRPELVAEIEFAGWTGAGHGAAGLLQGAAGGQAGGRSGGGDARPRRRRRRLRRPPPSVHAHQGWNDVVMGVPISHPDKTMWPQAGKDGKPVTKLDLARYYEAVGPWLLRHLKGRPCSIIRAPDGIGGQTFFQRHAMPGSSNLLELVTVSGDRKPYLRSTAWKDWPPWRRSRRWSFTPGTASPFHPDIPGRLVFDLDPGPEVDFPTVIDAAKEVRDRLEELGLVSFCKTTGGKGLHVVTPLARAAKGNPSWAEAKAFAQSRLPGDGRCGAGPLRDQHGQEAAHRSHLPRLLAQ